MSSEKLRSPFCVLTIANEIRPDIVLLDIGPAKVERL
jgi:hypothetical protein